MQEIKEDLQKTRRMFYEKLNTFLLAGFSFVAGLAWNDAIQSLFGYIWPKQAGSSIVAKFIYAISVTLSLTIVSIYISKHQDKIEKIQ
jgi:hypothetical protein